MCILQGFINPSLDQVSYLMLHMMQRDGAGGEKGMKGVVGERRGGGGEDLERTEERVYALVFDCVC